jgi:uncharacterized repeat protein (TIGR02543 family)
VISGRDGKIRRYTANVTVNITFETNGGNPVSTQVVNSGDTATRPDPSRIGYIFVDWYDDEGNEYDFDTPVFENITLYAGWKPITYTVIYDRNADNAEGKDMDPSNHIYDKDGFLTKNEFTRPGYDFAGWKTLDGEEFTSDEPITVRNLTATDGDIVTLYAIWVTEPYYVIYHANDGTGATEKFPFICDIDQKLINPFFWPDYTLEGWEWREEGVVFPDGAEVRNLAEPGKTVDLYAIRKLNQYNVLFIPNGGEPVPIPNPRTLDHGDLVDPPDPMTRGEYTFGGWYTDNTIFTNRWVLDKDRVTSDITLYARWYSIVTFDANGATSGTAPSPIEVNADTSIKIPNQGNLIRTGNTFGDWNERYDGMGEPHKPGDNFTPTKDTILYAKWTLNRYIVSFIPNGGTPVPIPNPQEVAHGEPVPQPPVTKTGYTFNGWYRDAAFTTIATGTVTGNITLYAKWTPKTYTIVYDKNAADAIGGTPSSTHTYDKEGERLTPNGYTRTGGYTFDGWKDGNGTPYTDNQLVKNLSSEDGAVVILYAQWKEGYTVTFVPNGGTPPPERQYKKDGQKVDRPVITRGDYNCLWYTDEAFTNEWDFATDTVTGNITLYARWFSIVTFDANNGNGGSVSEEVNAGGSIFIPYPSEFNFTPPSPGMYFYRWNDEADDTGTPYRPGPPSSIKPTGDITLYAIWRSYSPIPPGTSIIFINVKEQAPSLNEPIIISHTNNPYEGTLAGVKTGERYPKAVTITVGNPDDYSGIEWEIHGTSNSVSGTSITLNAANTYYNNIGYHYFTVYGVSKTDGKTYSRTITFIVVE